MENDIAIEPRSFSGNAGVSRRIYELSRSRKLIEFQRASEPLPAILDRS